MGNGIVNNGGGGDGDDDDDDEWFDEEDDGDGDGDGFMRRAGPLPELFDRRTVECVLQEWFRTLSQLPTGLRMAVEMGLVSSAQVVRFMTMNTRPTVARQVSRLLPAEPGRAFVGRMMGDAGFVYKLAIEQAITIGAAIKMESAARGKNLSKEWDLAATNVLALAAGNAAVVWMLSPNRTFGSPAQFRWQRILHSLPNHVFDACGPNRQYTAATRALGFASKGAQLAAAGAVIGAVSAAATSLCVARRKAKDAAYEPSVPVPDFNTSVGANALFLGASGNVRYQLLAGADRWMYGHLATLQLSMVGTGVLRFLNNRLGEPSRQAWLGQSAAVTATAAATAAAVEDDEYDY
jgi:hypothetical protein